MQGRIVEVAIIGAGPYGLSIAAHLRESGISIRIFGEPMQFWREMPPAMFLKSLGSATDIYTPGDRFPFVDYCKARGLEPEEPCAIADFARYGIEVQQTVVPEVEPVNVRQLARHPEGFEITLANSERLLARHVVVAIGLKAFASMPAEVRGLPEELASHTCHHASFGRFAGKKVFVLGAGQSAMQAAALLHEAGAEVEVLVREAKVEFSSHSTGEPSLYDRLRRPKSGLGSGLKNWLLEAVPGGLYEVPDRWRVPFVKTHLGPKVAWWLRERVSDKFPIHTHTSLIAARSQAERLTLSIRDQSKGVYEVTCDHIVAGTGFVVDVDRIDFFEPNLRQSIARVEGSPRLDRRFQSSVPGIFFVGTMSAMSFGPMFRFVVGAAYTSRVLTRYFAGLTPSAVLAQKGAASPGTTSPAFQRSIADNL
jgi:thioredoxin reductase